MKNIFTIISIFLLAEFAVSQSLERHVFASGGTFSSASSLSVSYTLGESVVASSSGTGIALSQGFQQGAKKTVTPPPDGISEEISFEVYPNPFQNQFYVKTDDIKNYSFEVIDLLGKIVNNQININSDIAVVDLRNCQSGLYFLKIFDSSGKHLNTIKVKKL